MLIRNKGLLLLLFLWCLVVNTVASNFLKNYYQTTP